MSGKLDVVDLVRAWIDRLAGAAELGSPVDAAVHVLRDAQGSLDGAGDRF